MNAGRGTLKMKREKGVIKSMKSDRRKSSMRATISFPPDIYKTLEVIAKEKKVSLSWVVRDATEQYVANKWPLFKEQG